MSKHTSGPWTAVRDNVGEGDWYILAPNEDVIGTGLGLSEPDARLIAAAPDLSDLAHNMAGLDDQYLANIEEGGLRALIRAYRKQARAAIAKAEGGS